VCCRDNSAQIELIKIWLAEKMTLTVPEVMITQVIDEATDGHSQSHILAASSSSSSSSSSIWPPVLHMCDMND
jgi:inner membrane protein involved in colicin E2 resistance